MLPKQVSLSIILNKSRDVFLKFFLCILIFSGLKCVDGINELNSEVECDDMGGAGFCAKVTYKSVKTTARTCAIPLVINKYGLTGPGCKDVIELGIEAKIRLCEGDLCNAY